MIFSANKKEVSYNLQITLATFISNISQNRANSYDNVLLYL